MYNHPKLYELGGLSSSAAEVDRKCDTRNNVVSITSSTATITREQHEGKTIMLNRAAGITATLPASDGKQGVYTFIVGTTVTSNNDIVKVANASDSFIGHALLMDNSGAAGNFTAFFQVTAGDDTVTMNGGTKGGYVGDRIVFRDVAANTWAVEMIANSSGTSAAPFSATVS